ncbi:hypothetical protein MPTK1_8g02440 [Marchantia polymorpha subsp. ruderalis]|uniref:NADH:quinone oxidoreductase/Mrp antiporter membrane subunit domain-containing protein n=1 Tax=Marchantia polymorpha TaxID=3197 RepID=A0A2R6XIY2_MARPO|nr:hypothetical protein MARPO_0012s0041 [Marchantia polymorpha]BBN18433.1 hypothetical protein Mp_8g02440 [Marchantia polymorpha subsp. ruderalis]|eukprot:PTQ46080.1 hypothetical protein MARPO_0012s0041 [Marchantia polymorpha]
MTRLSYQLLRKNSREHQTMNYHRKHANCMWFASSHFSRLTQQFLLKTKITYGICLIGIVTFINLGVNGAILQMISHGLIGASLFFLARTSYDRTRTLV